MNGTKLKFENVIIMVIYIHHQTTTLRPTFQYRLVVYYIVEKQPPGVYFLSRRRSINTLESTEVSTQLGPSEQSSECCCGY